jgi:hypothetical protein
VQIQLLTPDGGKRLITSKTTVVAPTVEIILDHVMGLPGSNRNDRLFGQSVRVGPENWREDFEVFRPFFQPTKKPTKLWT